MSTAVPYISIFFTKRMTLFIEGEGFCERDVLGVPESWVGRDPLGWAQVPYLTVFTTGQTVVPYLIAFSFLQQHIVYRLTSILFFHRKCPQWADRTVAEMVFCFARA